MKKIYFQFIDEQVFDATILVTYGSIDGMNDLFRQKKIKTYEETIPATTEAFTAKTSMFYSKKQDQVVYHIHFLKFTIHQIIHETNHLSYNILKDKQIDLYDETKEVFAYYQNYLVKKILSFKKSLHG